MSSLSILHACITHLQTFILSNSIHMNTFPIGLPVGTDCAALPDNYFYTLIKNKDRKLIHNLYSSFYYIDNVLSLNHSRFGDCLLLHYSK